MTLTFAIAWLFVHLHGYVLLGIALARARVIRISHQILANCRRQ